MTAVDTAFAAVQAALAVLQSAVAAAETPPPPAPTPASPQGSTITPGTSLPLIDSAGAAWTLGPDGTGEALGTVLFKNGVQSGSSGAGFTANVALALLWNGAIIQQNTVGNWWSGGPAWVELPGDPRATAAPPPSTPPLTPLAPGFYVSPSGSDSSAGTLAAPFASLEAAQKAMQASSTVKVTYLRAGSYARTAPLTLSSADAGETWQYYPPDGVNTAVLDGGSSVVTCFDISANDITLNGLKGQHFTQHFAHHDDGSTSIAALTIENCDIGFNTVADGFPGLIHINGANGVKIANNYVHDAQSQGIALYAYQTGLSLSGRVVGNVVLRTVLGESDGGAIYASMFSGFQGMAGGLTIMGNYVKDYGPAIPAHGIYLDDNCNNAVVTGNVIGPPNPSAIGNATSAVLVHNGHSNIVSGNIVDLGATGGCFAAVWFQDNGSVSGMADNTFTGNIVLSDFSGPLKTAFVTNGTLYDENATASDYTISGNFYWNYAPGGSIFSNGALASDTAPVTENCQLMGWGYAVGAPPSGWTALPASWGPPGFTVPQTGVTPSPVAAAATV